MTLGNGDVKKILLFEARHIKWNEELMSHSRKF